MPGPLHRLHQLALLLGGDAREHRVSAGDVVERGIRGVRRHRGHVDDVTPTLQAGLPGDGGDGVGMVAGDDLHVDALVAEVRQRLLGPRANVVAQRDQEHRLQRIRQTLLVRPRAGQVSDGDQTQSLTHQRGRLIGQVRAKDALRGAQEHGSGRRRGRLALLRVARRVCRTSRCAHRDGAPFALRRERDDGLRGETAVAGGRRGPHGIGGGAIGTEMGAQRRDGHVVVLAGVQVGAQQRVGILGGTALAERHDPVHAHVAVRQRAGLVEAQHVHMRQRLQRIDVLHEDLGLREADHAGGQRHGDQQHQSLRQHAEQRRGGRHHGVVRAGVPQEHRLDEQQHAQRDDQEAGEPGDLAHRIQQLGVHALLLAHLVDQRIRVVLVADMRHTGVRAAGNHRAAGIQLAAGGLVDGVAFAGQQRFVDFQTAVDDHGVVADLLAGIQHHDIVLDDVAGLDGRLLAVAQHHRVRLVEDRQLVDEFLRLEFLHDADDDVEDDDRDEQHVGVRADREQQYRYSEVQCVEQRADVLAQYRACRFGDASRPGFALASRAAFFDFRCSESCHGFDCMGKLLRGR